MNVKYSFWKSKILFLLIFAAHTQRGAGMDRFINCCTQTIRDGSYAFPIAMVFGGNLVFSGWEAIKKDALLNESCHTKVFLSKLTNSTTHSPTFALIVTTLLGDYFFGGNGLNMQLLATYTLGTGVALYVKKK
ncbi:hypothetical protein IPH25_02850 [bacterium]|nr:MAG: hypothetical protein IPG37_04990 [bacterium]QQR61405.1 MAG: hypothetical protein IPH25_02850 [bacterium]QQR63073.1 MAG: hypothetical protein IPH67_01185 [bacterium]